MEKIRFTFSEEDYKLAEAIDNPEISMYWEKKQKTCPHCKEIIKDGEHVLFTRVEFWIPITKKEEEITLKDLVVLGKKERLTLLLSKDKMLEAIDKSEKFKFLKGV